MSTTIFFIFFGIKLVIIIVVGVIIPASKWEAIPTINEYKRTNPESVTDRGMRCVNCKSSSIKSMGLKSPTDKRRIFICNHCGTQLYRTDNEYFF